MESFDLTAVRLMKIHLDHLLLCLLATNKKLRLCISSYLSFLYDMMMIMGMSLLQNLNKASYDS